MRIITYNLHKGRDRRRRDVLAAAADALAAHEPDLVFCQEVQHLDGQIRTQAATLSHALGLDHVFSPNAFYKTGCHGNATFSRYGIASTRNINVTESYFEKRGILHTRLDVDGIPVDTLNVHFSLTGRQRRRQWKRLQSCLPEDPDIPVLACGDFNDWAQGLDLRARRSGLLHNALWDLPRRARYSFPARRPILPMDRIYYRNCELVEVTVLRGAPWDQLSDHLPICARLEPRG